MTSGHFRRTPVRRFLPSIVMPEGPGPYRPVHSAGSRSPPGSALREDRVAPAVLARPGGVRVGGQGPVELAAGADAELGEDLAQVVLDRAGADEQPGADLRIGQAVPGQPGDLGLPGGQLASGLHGALAG